MTKRIIISILTIYMLLTPINVYANQNINKYENEELNNITNNAVSNNSEIDYYENKVTIEYNKAEQKALDNAPNIGCKAAYIADPITGKIFYEKNAHEKMYPASTTKILTALVVLEKCELTEKAVVSRNALKLVPSGYSNAKLQAGEELDIKTLLYALLIPSANEAANVLAEHVSGSIEAFAELCNNRAKELGCETLHFVNPNGLHDKNHYCSAYDLYLIAKECQKHEVFRDIVQTKNFTVPATNIYRKNDRTFYNTNSLILPSAKSYYYSYCTGIKTGHTTPAGECLVASSSHDNIDLISVVLGGGTNSKGLNERFYDTKQLFEFVYNNYSYKKIVDEKTVEETVHVKKATRDTASLDIIINTSISGIIPKDLDINKIQSNINIYDEIVAPIKQNQKLGNITIDIDGVKYTAELVASHDVEKPPFWIQNMVVVGIIIFIILIISLIIKKQRIKKRKLELKNRYS